MNIAVNTRLLLKDKLEGIGRFTVEHFSRICKDHPEHQFYFLFDRPYADEFIFADNVTPIVAGPPARHPVLFYIWFNWVVPGLLKKFNADLFISPDGYLPLRGNTPTLAVFHDINFHHFPKDFRWDIRWYYNYFFPRFAHKANRIVTVSEFSKSDIMKAYNTEGKKIDVVYNAAHADFSPTTEQIQTHTRKQITNGKPYFLFVGALNPRKNITRLLQSFDIFKNNTNSPTQLVIVGEKMFGTNQMERTYQQMTHKSEVHFIGRKSPQELRLIYNTARALVFVPYFEGFGIPLVEAMKCETPVISANTSSLPEVAGQAAIYADPYNCHDIAQAMQQMDADEQLRLRLIEKGKTQAAQYNWNIAAQQLWQIIEKMLPKSKQAC